MILTQYVHSTVLDSKHKALLDTYYNMSKSNDTFSLPWFRCEETFYYIFITAHYRLLDLKFQGFHSLGKYFQALMNKQIRLSDSVHYCS